MESSKYKTLKIAFKISKLMPNNITQNVDITEVYIPLNSENTYDEKKCREIMEQILIDYYSSFGFDAKISGDMYIHDEGDIDISGYYNRYYAPSIKFYKGRITYYRMDDVCKIDIYKNYFRIYQISDCNQDRHQISCIKHDGDLSQIKESDDVIIHAKLNKYPMHMNRVFINHEYITDDLFNDTESKIVITNFDINLPKINIGNHTDIWIDLDRNENANENANENTASIILSWWKITQKFIKLFLDETDITDITLPEFETVVLDGYVGKLVISPHTKTLDINSAKYKSLEYNTFDHKQYTN